MRHFAQDLQLNGWSVDYHQLSNTPDFLTGLERHLQSYLSEAILITEPNDWPMAEALGQRRPGICDCLRADYWENV